MFAPLTAEEVESVEPVQRVPDKVPIVPVPDDAPPMAFKLPKLGVPSHSWPYHDASGKLVGYVCRWDFLDEDGQPAKEVRPVTFCDLGEGRRAWRSKGIPAPRPLYGLPLIRVLGDRPILVCEGEKARDAASVLFPDMVATTPAHGAKSPQLTDFSPCAGRTVVIATDHDEPGRKDGRGKPLHPGRDFGDKVCELARAAGAKEVLHLRPDRLGSWVWRAGERQPRDDELPDGWDLADALEEGWSAEAVAPLQSDPAFLPPYLDERERAELEARAAGLTVADPDEERGWPFRIVSSGVEKRIERTDKDLGITTIEWRWFCSPLDVVADTRNVDSEEWGRLLELEDRDGRKKRWAMPMAMLAGDGNGYRERLLSLGLVMAPGTFARNALHEYISTARPSSKARCVSRTGWHDGTYLAFPRNYGESDERFIVQRPEAAAANHSFRERGDLADWQENVARFAVGNSRLVLAISAAFAAPLLYPVNAEGGGFHFRGASSTGKSTTLVVAGSVWGGGGLHGFLKTWRGTANGLEGTAATHSDSLLCLDEIGQVSGQEAGQVAYMLANGQGKTRAGRGGETRPSAEWRLLFLSSGEIGLSDKMAEDGRGRRAAAGQEVRVVDVPADAGAGFGLFEDLHGFASAVAFADHLKRASGESYGTPARAFLEALTANFEAIAPAVKAARDDFMSRHCPQKADGQVARVAARFALVAAAGEMAAALGILPWADGEAERGAARCLADWLEARGGTEASEERQAIASVRRFIEAHGSSRFEGMGELAPKDRDGYPAEQRTINRAGFRRRNTAGETEYLVLPEAWKAEVCIGLDPSLVARTLADRGMLQRDGAGKTTLAQRLPGFSAEKTRVYVLTAKLMGDGAGA